MPQSSRSLGSAAALTFAALSLALVGCGTATTITPDTTVKARLDRENGQVVLPADEYTPTASDEAASQEASQAILRECLQTKGENGLPPIDFTTVNPGFERPYGLWLPEEAARIGFIPPQREEPVAAPASGVWSDETSDSFNRAYEECKASIGGAMEDVMTIDPTMSVVSAVTGEASEMAWRTPEWTAARDEWKTCLADAGLTPPAEESEWVSQQSSDILADYGEAAIAPETKKEEIRLALLEATCNEQVDLTQRLGDIEASYQAALIKDKAAQLEQEKADNQKKVDSARAYLANHQ